MTVQCPFCMFLLSFIALLSVRPYVKQSISCHLCNFILILPSVYPSSHSLLQSSVSLRSPFHSAPSLFPSALLFLCIFSNPDPLLFQCESQILFVVTHDYTRSTCDQNNLILKDGCSMAERTSDRSKVLLNNCNDTLVKPQYVHWCISITNLCLHWTAVLSYPLLSSPLISPLSVISEN